MNHTVLVIEDEAPIRANLLRFLRLEGYATLEAENGRIGVERLRDAHPDLILCDVMMPEMDGFAVLASVRANPATAGIPFVLLTASADIDALERGRSLGVDEYVTKPFVLPELAALVARLTRREGA